MNTLKRDNSGLQGQVIGLAPIGVETISADTAIDHLAITLATNSNIYFLGDATTFAIEAGTTIVVSPKLRLSTSTKCLVY
jgi:hypothetical protein